MKLWEHPRLTGALCAAAVLACAAMPAAFLAVTDAAYIGRVVPVADPYTAPTPAADDYYILRQLAARRQDSAELPRAEEPTAPGTPKMYIGASASLESMNYADAATADALPLPDETALRAFAAQAGLESLGDWAVPADSAYRCALCSENGQALITASTHPYTYGSYTGAAGDRWYYSLSLRKM